VKKTSIYLDDELDRALARRAAEEGLSKAELIRRTLAGVASRPRRVKPQGVGVITGKGPAVARDVDAALRDSGFGDWP
jgi:hypothetical protein